MTLNLSRRAFIKAGAVASASAMVLGSAGQALADEAADAAGNVADDIQVIPSACRQ